MGICLICMYLLGTRVQVGILKETFQNYTFFGSLYMMTQWQNSTENIYNHQRMDSQFQLDFNIVLPFHSLISLQTHFQRYSFKSIFSPPLLFQLRDILFHLLFSFQSYLKFNWIAISPFHPPALIFIFQQTAYSSFL